MKLAEVKQLNDIAPWRLAVVLETGDQSARIGLQPAREPGGALTKERPTGTIPLDGMKWAKPTEGPRKGRVPTKVSQCSTSGDVVYVEPLNKEANTWRLRQVPEVSGAMVVMDPPTGRVLAMVGGFSYDQSQFNRATQAMRQPGSSFKPFVYATALDNGYTPSTLVLDGPIEIDQGPGMPPWRPENYSVGKYYGPSTLRFGIEQSRNTMTVRLAQDVGMPLIVEYAAPLRRLRQPAGLSVVRARRRRNHRAAHGDRLFDVRQRRQAHHPDVHRPHPGPLRPHRLQARPARMPRLQGRQVEEPVRAEPGRPARAGDRSDDRLPDHLDHGGRGAARHGDRGAARSASRSPARPAPPTTRRTPGSSAISPDIAVGVYIGYDKPRHLGRGATGGHIAAPIVADFLKVALADKPAGAVPRAGGHQAHPRRRQDRPCAPGRATPR